MEYALFALPIHSDRAEAARAFLHELEGARKSQYAVSEQRLGITKEVWAVQQTPSGQVFAVFFQSDNIGAAVSQFVGSQDAFDQWFKAEVRATTGVDLNEAPSGPLSEILSVYDA